MQHNDKLVKALISRTISSFREEHLTAVYSSAQVIFQYLTSPSEIFLQAFIRRAKCWSCCPNLFLKAKTPQYQTFSWMQGMFKDEDFHFTINVFSGWAFWGSWWKTFLSCSKVSQFAKCCWVYITIWRMVIVNCFYKWNSATKAHQFSKSNQIKILKDGHCQTASINEILQQKHINFLAISEPYYNIINIDEPSLQRCTLSSPRAKRAGPKGLRAESARALTVQ